MLAPDFTKYSLALLKDNKIVYSSNKSGLRPLLDCIIKYRGEFTQCTLHDKVIGLAAARLVVFSGMISLITAKVSSKSAKKLIEENNICLTSQAIVENILNNDKSGVCPGELKAQKIKDNKSFFLQMKDLFKI